MIVRTFARVFPRQSPSSMIFRSIDAEAASTGIDFFMCDSNSGTYFSCAQRCVHPSQSEAFSGQEKVTGRGPVRDRASATPENFYRCSEEHIVCSYLAYDYA